MAPDASDELIGRTDLTSDAEMKEALVSPLKEQDKQDALFQFTQSSVVSDKLLLDQRLPYKLMEIDGTGQDWGTSKFISKFAAAYFLQEALQRCQREQAKIASMMKDPFSMQAFGHMFKEWAYKQLVQGKLCNLGESEMKGQF